MSDNKKTTHALILGLAATLWLIVVLVGYYYTHKPFRVEFVGNMLIILWRLVVAGMIISLSGGIGTWILSKQSSLPPLVGIALSAALGAGILGLVLLFLGLIIGFRPLYFVVLLLVMGVLYWKFVLIWLQRWKILKSYFGGNRLINVLSIGCGLILFWTLVLALAPPLHFDALTYHLALPRSYLVTGDMAYSSDSMFWGMPQQTEMLYTFAMALADAEAAVAVGWGFGFLSLVGLLGYVSEKINPTAGWVSVICLLGGFSIAESLSWGYSEWQIMLYGFGMLVILETWKNSHQRTSLIFAAILAGFALSAKYTAGQLILIGVVIIIWDGLQRRDRHLIANLLLFSTIAALVSTPWWVKNWLATVNPFYPLLFPSGAMTQARLDYYTSNIWGDWLDMLILPWQVTVWGVEGKVGFSWSIGPLLLGFGMLSWIGWKSRTREQKQLLSTATIATLTSFVIWALASRWNGYLIQSRLYAAFFPAWAILGGFGFDALSRVRTAGIRFGRIATIVLLMVFTFNLVEMGQEFSKKGPFYVLIGDMTPATYLIRNLGAYSQAMVTLEGLPSNARILMLWETRSLACLPACDPDEVIDRWYDDTQTYADSDQILRAWRAQGYTHLLLHVAGLDFVRESDSRISAKNWGKLDSLLNSLTSPDKIAPSYELYELSAP